MKVITNTIIIIAIIIIMPVVYVMLVQLIRVSVCLPCYKYAML